jgi:hypothetical protein
MKKGFLITIIIITLLAWVFVSASTAVPSTQTVAAKPTQKNTPGAKATEKAIQHATEGKGNGNKNKNKQNFSGTIEAVDSASLTLTLEDGSSVSFIIDEQTRIQIPTLGKDATTEVLQIGAQAKVRASGDGSGTLTAIFINVVPGKPVKIHRVGDVTEYIPGTSITIADSEGNTYTFLVDENTVILPAERSSELAVGSHVTIICPRDVTGGPLLAAGIVVHPATTGGEEESQETESPQETESVETTEEPAATETEAP